MLTSTERLAIWLLGLGETIVWAFLFYIFAAFLLTWETTLGWPKTDLTLGLTIAILAAAAASPIAGRVIDAGYGRWALSGGAIVGAMALTGLSYAEITTNYWVCWGVMGAAQGFCLYEPCFSVVTRAMGDKARPGVIRITLIAGFASALSFLLSGALLAEIDWRETARWFAAATAILGAPMLFAGALLAERGRPPEPNRAEARAANQAAFSAALRKPAFWLIALAFPLMAINHGILLNHIMPLLDERGVARETAILVASTIGPMQVAGRVVLMLLEKRLANVAFAVISFGGVFIASFLLMAAEAAAVFAFAFAIVQGGAYGLTSIVKPAITAEFLGRAGFGAIAGWLAFPYLVGFASAPFIGALIWQAGGYDLVLPATAGFAAAGVLCMLLLVWLRKRTADKVVQG